MPPLLLWLDLEMTGLDIYKDQIIEVAALLTDMNLQELPESRCEYILACPDALLDGMDAWCTKTHGESGLTQACRLSNVTLADAEQHLLQRLQQLGCVQGQLFLAGNSIHADRTFLQLQMPRFVQFLHYRQVDVSSLKCLAQSWVPELESRKPVKQGSHRALGDLLESLEELRYYRKHWLITPPS
ncbi:putative oligoribonuclease [Protomyces lactucae-debilis]|uniref:Putative oligoribonuclease n=1 Tax=Protomyces lactucae-debilis TaxID=2754530 RepID=A0A1Y2FTP1_PROLT|nr:putative oligoribonuclease [Protomyces lactucae-debilis]ORY86947.1 putative oligoribonuclease [Protomyces lactucae-debilis]